MVQMCDIWVYNVASILKLSTHSCLNFCIVPVVCNSVLNCTADNDHR